MNSKPILFSAPMVRALLDGSKTQTRRAMNERHQWHFIEGQGDLGICPYGQPGDQLWVKETHWRDDEDGAILYAANSDDRAVVDRNKHETGSPRYNWKPSIFMRREYSRITLEIVGVRVERLQDISEADARAEGIEQVPCSVPDTRKWKNYTPSNGWTPSVALAENSYRTLWESINGPGSWDANPWVWCVSFKRVV